MTDIYKCVSLNQPFASLIALGYKTIETRVAASSVAKTRHRGHLLIATTQKVHPCWKNVAKFYKPGFPLPFQTTAEYFIDPYLKYALDVIFKSCGSDWEKFESLMLIGMDEPSILASCTLKAVGWMTKEHQTNACWSLFPSAKAMALENVKQLAKPIPLHGISDKFRLGVFNVRYPS